MNPSPPNPTALKNAATFILILLAFFIGFVGLIGLAGCSSRGGEEPDEIKPVSLEGFNEEVELTQLWSRNLGDGGEDKAIRLRPIIAGGRIYAASASGEVVALQTSGGRVLWSQHVSEFYTKEELATAFTDDMDIITGGVGAGSDLVVVAVISGDIIAMNQPDGSLAWRVPASSEVLSPPVVDRDLVFVQSIDGKLAAYKAIDGERVWIYSATTPSLTLRGTSTPVLFGDYVIAGFGNGRIVILDRGSGLVRLDQRVAVSEGESDLEKLVDIDGNIEMTDEGRLYVASFQGRLIGVDARSGRMMWSEKSSSVSGVGIGFGNVYLAHADDRVSAFNADSGREVWQVDALLHRDISAPVAIGSYIAVTDYEGYVHLLAQADGRFVGRRKVDGDGLQGGLVVSEGRLYALGDGGRLSVLEIR